MTDPTVTFEPPGKGEWRSLRDHFPRALTPEYARLLPAAMNAGEALVMEEYGLPVRSLVAGLSHGHVYIAPEPLLGKPSDALPPRRRAVGGDPTRAGVPPPHQGRRALPRRAPVAGRRRALVRHRAEHVGGGQPGAAGRGPDDMDAPALVDHLRRVRAHAAAGYERHFALHGPDLMPIGLLLARAAELGLGPELRAPGARRRVADLDGSRPGPRRAARCGRRGRARARAPSTSVRAVAGPELDAFLAEHGWRLVTGYDIDSLALDRAARRWSSTSRDRPRATPSTRTRRRRPSSVLADKVGAPPTATSSARLVDDARATVGLRDDNGAVTAAWPAGLLRRAMLAAGRRLVDRGVLADVDHAVEVTVDELVDLLEGTSAARRRPRSRRAAPIGRRARSWCRRSSSARRVDIPVDVLPAPMRTMARALFALREVVDGPDRVPGPASTATASDRRCYRGRACVATDPGDALDRLEPGDVLVAFGTTPAYNMVLSIVGAVVVEEGGLLSHAAVIARELGLSAVIGAAGAMADDPRRRPRGGRPGGRTGARARRRRVRGARRRGGVANAHAWFEHHSGWAPPDEAPSPSGGRRVCRAPDECLVRPTVVCPRLGVVEAGARRPLSA